MLRLIYFCAGWWRFLGQFLSCRMIWQFEAFWEKWREGQKSDRFLLAVSGGLDSMVMSQLFLEQGFHIGIAHCNFQLRERASDEDARFVAAFAQGQQIPFYLQNFDTSAIATQKRQSIQECARELRYEWLENTRSSEGYDWLVTAHHLNDNIETLLYNLTKGSGIRGLHGIPSQQGKLLRPLSEISRKELENYAQQQQIAFREDASNAEIKYRRNLLRHRVIPVLREINPNLEQTFRDNLQRFRESEVLYHYAIEQLRAQFVQNTDRGLQINWAQLQSHPARDTLLYEYLHPYGFSPPQIRQIAQGGVTASGRLFYSRSHRLLVDREHLELRVLTTEENKAYLLEAGTTELSTTEGTLQIQLLDAAPESFPRDPNRAYLAAEHLQFPLRLRRWRAGDYFQPLGMDGHRQKLQDYFSNAKLSRFAKEHVWLLASGEQICWVVGWRSDERFRVKDKKALVYELRWTPIS